MRLATLETSNARQISNAQLLKAIISVGAVAVIAERLWIMSSLPLWLDETWSAMIATQPSWQTFWHEAWLDCNPPLYYLLIKVWAVPFGNSNFALRLPSLFFTTSAALIAVHWGKRKLGDIGAWTWGGLILFWMHSLTMSVDVRGYGLLLFLSTSTCIAFARLYTRITFHTAALWVALCTLMFLTHYFAATLIAAQGCLLLYRHRGDLLKVWPTGLIGAPALAWFAYHLPRLQDYARPDVVWYEPLNLSNAIIYTRYVFGHPAPSFLPLVLLTVLAGLAFNLREREHQIEDLSRNSVEKAALKATALSGAIGFALAFAIGALHASLTHRYLVPLVPPIMLGLVLVALRSTRRGLICTLLMCIYLISSLNFMLLREFSQNRNDYGYEKGSEFLAKYRPTHLIFAWDHPAAKILERNSLEQIGSFFLERAGIHAKTTAFVLQEYENPNILLTDAAEGERPAIIWIYNTSRKSAARQHPPMLGNDPAWLCRHYSQPASGGGELGAIACVKKGRGHA